MKVLFVQTTEEELPQDSKCCCMVMDIPIVPSVGDKVDFDINNEHSQHKGIVLSRVWTFQQGGVGCDVVVTLDKE